MDKTTVYWLIGFLLAFLGLGVGLLRDLPRGSATNRYKRELEHKERMRRCELGRTPAGRSALALAPRIGFLMATGRAALWRSASRSLRESHAMAIHHAIWQTAGDRQHLRPSICGLRSSAGAMPSRRHRRDSSRGRSTRSRSRRTPTTSSRRGADVALSTRRFRM